VVIRIVEVNHKLAILAAVIIESGFDDATSFYVDCMVDKTREQMSEAAKKQLTEVAQEFLNNSAKMKDYQGPVLIFHCKDDQVVPVSNGKALFQALSSEHKKICLFDTGGHFAFLRNHEEYITTLNEFITRSIPSETIQELPQTEQNMSHTSSEMLQKFVLAVLFFAAGYGFSQVLSKQ